MNKKLYFGWIVLFGVAISMGLVVALSVSTFGIFVVPVVKKLGISTSVFMSNATIITLMGIVVSPFAGKLIDKKGLRFTAVLSGCFMFVAYCLLGLAKTIPLFYIGYGLIGVANGLGGLLVINTVSARWFNKYRGLASGIGGAGSGVLITILSPVLSKILTNSGYSTAYFFLAGVVAVLVILVGLLCIRNSPEEMGLHPDGASASVESAGNSGGNITGMTLKEALKTRNFWCIITAFPIFILASLGILMTYNPAFQSVGFSPMTAAIAVSTYGIISIFAKILLGALMDKVSLKFGTILGFGLVVISCLIMISVKTNSSILFIYVFAVLYAIGNSSWAILLMKYIAEFCGRKFFASISGFVFMLMNIGGMVGPLVGSSIFDLTGSYYLAYVVFSCLVAISCIILMFAKKQPDLSEKNI